MADMKIDNTEAAWGEALLRIAAEARADAEQRDSGLVLAQTLDDLARVLESYAARLGVEKLPARFDELLGGADEAVLAATLDAVAGSQSQPSWLEAFAALEARVAAVEARPASEPYDLPGWVRDTLQSHHERISTLEAALADALEKIEWLEANASVSTVAPSQPFVPDAPIDPSDYTPEAWGSAEQARAALGRRIHREHKNRAAIRQTVLNDVMNLASIVERTDDEEARLNQHRARANRLADLDVIRDVKLDQVAALDDLEAARLYDVEAGWPE